MRMRYQYLQWKQRETVQGYVGALSPHSPYIVSKWPVTQKSGRLYCKKEWILVVGLRPGIIRIWSTFGPLVFWSFRVICCTCLKMACNSKTAGNRSKRSEIWDLEVVTIYIYMRYLWSFSVQGHFEVICCTCLKVACNSKTAGRRAKGVKFGIRG